MENIEKCGMKVEEAIKLLHPDTTEEVIAEIEYKYGFRGKQLAINKINEACVMACEAMEKQIPQTVEEFLPLNRGRCPACNGIMGAHASRKYCYYCGQALDWSDV